MKKLMHLLVGAEGRAHNFEFDIHDYSRKNSKMEEIALRRFWAQYSLDENLQRKADGISNDH